MHVPHMHREEISLFDVVNLCERNILFFTASHNIAQHLQNCLSAPVILHESGKLKHGQLDMPTAAGL